MMRIHLNQREVISKLHMFSNYETDKCQDGFITQCCGAGNIQEIIYVLIDTPETEHKPHVKFSH